MIPNAPSMAFPSRQTPPGGGWTAIPARLGGLIERALEAERGQIALWSPVALGAGIAAWFALPGRAEWMALCCLCLAGATALLFVARGHGRLARYGGIALLLIAGGVMLGWARAEMVSHTVLARTATVSMRAEVGRVERLAGRGTVRLTLRPMARPDLPERVRVNLPAVSMPGDAPIRGGDVVRVRARLMPPAGPALPGGYDYARRAWFDGIGATGRALSLKIEGAGGDARESLRDWLSNHVASRVGGAPGAIAVTLASGDRGRMTPEDDEAMRASGLAHLLSISGVHVTAVIGAVVFLVFRLLALSTRLALRWPLLLIAAAAGAGVGLGYTLLTGAEVPTIRSCISALLVMAGLALGREAISLRLLACGALFVMVLWPEAVVGPSFQLSFTAVTAIVALYEHPRVRALFQARDEAIALKAARLVGALFATGLAVEAALMPIALYHFHKTGLLGALANMIAIPLTEFVVMPAEGLALALDTVGLGAPAWWVVEQALALLLAVAHGVAAQTAAVALTPAIPPLAFIAVMGGLYWLMLWRSAIRWAGLPISAIGLAGYALAPVPDILVSADGRHVALRTPDGMALLRDRAGDYMRDQFAEQAAFDGELGAVTDLEGARCSDEFCAVDLKSGTSDDMRKSGTSDDMRSHRILMARTSLSVPWVQLIRACIDADIVIAQRRLPDACRPRWLKLDRPDLASRGGAAIFLGGAPVKTASAYRMKQEKGPVSSYGVARPPIRSSRGTGDDVAADLRPPSPKGWVRRSRDPYDQHPWAAAAPSARRLPKPQL